MVEKLDLSKNEAVFIASWRKALEDGQFLAIWRLAFQMTIGRHHQPYVYELTSQVESLVAYKLSQPCYKTIEWLIGLTLMKIGKPVSVLPLYGTNDTTLARQSVSGLSQSPIPKKSRDKAHKLLGNCDWLSSLILNR